MTVRKQIGDVMPREHVQCEVDGCERDYTCVMRNLTVQPPHMFHPELRLETEGHVVKVVCQSFDGTHVGNLKVDSRDE